MTTMFMGMLIGGLTVAVLYGGGAWATRDPAFKPFAWAGLAIAGLCGIGLWVTA